jgi:hypothetical protein
MAIGSSLFLVDLLYQDLGLSNSSSNLKDKSHATAKSQTRISCLNPP